MSSALDNQVTRPFSFDPEKRYRRVIARGDEWLGDYDVNDLQAILWHALEEMGRHLFKEGGIVRELGGTIDPADAGVVLGDDQVASAGAYTGGESQVFTVRIVTAGAAGVATYTWQSTGSDNPTEAEFTASVTAIAPDVATGLANLASYGHRVGTSGVLVVFANPTGTLVAGNTWVIRAAHAEKLPTVAGNDITVPDLVVYTKGAVHIAAGVTLTYPAMGSGVSTVYGELLRTIVTDTDDPSLRDPASDTPQAYREKAEFVVTNVDNSGAAIGAGILERRVFPLYEWDRATDEVRRAIPQPYSIPLEKTEGALDARRLLNIDLNEVLRGHTARRWAAHGGFVVEPLAPTPRVSVSASTPTPGFFRFTVPPLRALVEGVEVERELPEDVELPQAASGDTVVSETHAYVAANDPFFLAKALADPPFPITAVTRLSGDVQVGTLGVANYEAVVRGAGSFDNLGHTGIVAILRVSDTNGGPADYVAGTDYQLTGAQIEWLVGGSAPGTGLTYYVVYTYRKLLVGGGADYSLLGDGSVTFAVGGDNPVEGSVFEVDYTFGIPRFDVIGIRPTGALVVIAGLPAETPQTPPVPDLVLPYVTIRVPAAGGTPVIRRVPNDAITMARLNAVQGQIEELTRNIAELNLLMQARDRTSADLADILSDSFRSLETADLAFTGAFLEPLIDLAAGEASVAFDALTDVPTRAAVAPGETEVRVARFYTIPYTHELAINSSGWSQSYPVNPYADSRPEPPSFRIEPSRDLWPAGPNRPTTTRLLEAAAAETYHLDTQANPFSVTPLVDGVVDTLAMRSIPVRCIGHGFTPGEQVRIRFAARDDLPLTPVAPTVQGVDTFTVVARLAATAADGDWIAEFTVPTDVPMGVVVVEAWGDNAVPGSVWPGDFVLKGTTPFTSVLSPTRRRLGVEQQHPPVQNSPIAQSFSFGDARMLSKIEFPLAFTPGSPLLPPLTKAVLVTEVRETDRAGRASSPVVSVLDRRDWWLTEATAGAASVNVHEMADPILMERRDPLVFVLHSASSDWQAYVAERGKPNQGGAGFLTQQIESGVFMDSSNNVDWTLRQDFDLRCKVYTIQTTVTEAVLQLTRLTPAQATGVFLVVDQVIPDGTSIDWYYSIDGLPVGDGGKVWTGFLPFRLAEFPTTAAAVDVRAVLRTTDTHLTPSINARNLVIVLHENRITGWYVSRRKVLTAPATTIRGAIELRTPVTAVQQVWISVTDGAQWTQATLLNPRSCGEGFLCYDWEAVSVNPGTQLRVRIVMGAGDLAQRPRIRSYYAFAEP